MYQERVLMFFRVVGENNYVYISFTLAVPKRTNFYQRDLGPVSQKYF